MTALSRTATSIAEAALVAGEHIQHKDNTQEAGNNKQFIDKQAWQESLELVLNQHYNQ